MADVITLGARQDATLYENVAGMAASGAGTGMFVGKIARGGLIRRSLISFDVAGSIPAGSTITRVELTLSVTRSAGSSLNIGLHRLLAGWGEGASDAGAPAGGGGVTPESGDATWIHRFFGGAAWSNPGGDFVGAASATRGFGGVGTYTYASSAGSVADVQAWLNTPGANYGWLLKGPETQNGNARRIATHEEPIAALRPRLLIEYTPIPAPAACAPLLWLVALRRRR
ncbi:MAG: DNRLRE domain-containing protein [Phycisphaerales bacterium]|nr:DNRLRE domain-containing protein [Phycisphaerales bacterium]